MEYLIIALLLAGFVAAQIWWQRRHAALVNECAAQSQTSSALRTELEQVSAERQAQLETIFNSMTEGVLVLDQSGRIQLVNRSVENLFSVGTDVRGRTILEAFRLPELAALVKRLPVEERVAGHELELHGIEDRWLQVNAAAVRDRHGQQRGAILVFHDLTQMKELENTRRDFVANVSHELRTPLSLIKGFVETLLDGARKDPEVATRFLQTIKKHTDRLTFLIEDLLTISRLESGPVALNLQALQLRLEAQRVIDDLGQRAAEKQVKVQNVVPPELWAKADAERIHQVLFNLLENALKYGRAAGHVAIGGEAAGEGMVRLWVADEGPGIPPEACGRIFERFYRVDRARSRETGGTGLGLAIVKHIVQAHGGEVWVKSVAGSGSTFYFTLPETSEAAGEAEL